MLLALCAYYSVVTLGPYYPNDASAGRKVASAILKRSSDTPTVVIIARDTKQDREFSEAVREAVEVGGGSVLAIVNGDPSDAGAALRQVGSSFERLDAIATNETVSGWGALRTDRLEKMAESYPGLAEVQVFKPKSYRWPSFLTWSNLSNVIKQNAVIAIIAIGMTLVIITAGIDLSVGSVFAVCGVTTAVSIHHIGGGADAGFFGLAAGCLIGVGAAALCGVFNGVMVTWFRVPAFLVTLAVMMMARSLALQIAVKHQEAVGGGGTPEAVSIASDAFSWLSNGAILGVSNPILLMVGLYIVAHITMTRTSIGRYIYAVGGNPEAARLSGVPVFGVLILVYAICGAMAGIAGIVDASQFEGGRPIAGGTYELQVIAAVVVGGTSLAGGEGTMFGTLVGAMMIAVINNGLNMAGVQPYEKLFVFGALILVAVLLNGFKQK